LCRYKHPLSQSRDAVCVLYTQSKTESNGPRRITVILPGLDDNGRAFPFRPLHVSIGFFLRKIRIGITRCAQGVQTPPRLLHCLGERGSIVGEKRGVAVCRVKIYRTKLNLCNANGSGKYDRRFTAHPDLNPV